MENTRYSGCWKLLHEDHLHTRGEYRDQTWPATKSSGSPPHTWRILANVVPWAVLVGITSTHVENTTQLSLLNLVIQDHLHTRGEYTPAGRMKVNVLGSPPHTWRILVLRQWFYGHLRITSTHVENTWRGICELQLIKDHLHTRGEYANGWIIAAPTLGSPPHTWRIPHHFFIGNDMNRITSTHVENTVLRAPFRQALQDHLHTRGEYMTFCKKRLKKSGSPPHTWRIPHLAIWSLPIQRITSTHVENTVNKSQYNNNHKTIDPKISSLCQLLLYLFLSH